MEFQVTKDGMAVFKVNAAGEAVFTMDDGTKLIVRSGGGGIEIAAEKKEDRRFLLDVTPNGVNRYVCGRPGTSTFKVGKGGRIYDPGDDA